MPVDMNVAQAFMEQVQEMGKMEVPSKLSDQERVETAKQVIRDGINAQLAIDLEACVHCGLCAEACHFYLASKDPKHTPIRKLDLMKRMYRRERSPARWLYRLFVKDVTIDDLNEWEELVYDSCTVCMRCSLICPMGINIGGGVAVMRAAMRTADLMPVEMRLVGQEQAEKGTIFGVGSEQFVQTLEELRKTGLKIPLDEPEADILVLSAVTDIVLFKDTLVSTIKIMNHIGAKWTFSSQGYESANFGYMTGDQEWQCAASKRVYDAAVACGAKTVIVAECGHSYPTLRWAGAELMGKPLPFEVLAPSEFLGREIQAGRLKVKPIGKQAKFTFHDPCKIGRIGGVVDAPRVVLDALGVDLTETEPHGVENLCCGGGGGNFLITRALPLRLKVFELKMKQFDDTGAEEVVTSCDSCMMNIMAGTMAHQWPKPTHSLMDLVGHHLA
ncbi:MAG: 4Fe-4S dicluster domain-containing protein [Gammaproteobacteria bacterium]|nr:4Fe-4S dicluster domain-containing protein [Gammaproteobacteria bacterium]